MRWHSIVREAERSALAGARTSKILVLHSTTPGNGTEPTGPRWLIPALADARFIRWHTTARAAGRYSSVAKSRALFSATPGRGTALRGPRRPGKVQARAK